MLEYLRKRQVGLRTQEAGAARLAAAPPAGVSNQAMLAMLEGQRAQTAARPSGGTPLADAMRAKFERQFGLPMDDVRVHHNSAEPAKFDAGAYTYGTDIFIGPGQEELLNHEMTHVAQQKMGQVRPTGMEHGMAVNRSSALEHSADTGAVAQTIGTAVGPVVQCGKTKKEGSLKKPNPKQKTNITKKILSELGVTEIHISSLNPERLLGIVQKMKKLKNDFPNIVIKSFTQSNHLKPSTLMHSEFKKMAIRVNLNKYGKGQRPVEKYPEEATSDEYVGVHEMAHLLEYTIMKEAGSQVDSDEKRQLYIAWLNAKLESGELPDTMKQVRTKISQNDDEYADDIDNFFNMCFLRNHYISRRIVMDALSEMISNDPHGEVLLQNDEETYENIGFYQEMLQSYQYPNDSVDSLTDLLLPKLYEHGFITEYAQKILESYLQKCLHIIIIAKIIRETSVQGLQRWTF